ncbi:FAD:protein FMN transferase [Roseateles koreensis]|uniref:FAD:protein FMN transferase n=1 Tax=Roseateles koreensis TaxID=2987526 RepID=A0ABT5KRB9_9BURK|nr:FAD:protein FMN transferase [Roseateles koreensis]MDC8785397.1 FAD:protein FMN transferase [Roseateles koreensis]
MPQSNETEPEARRRAQALLGTLCEISLPGDATPQQFEAGFAALRHVQALLSRFEPSSDIARFNALSAGDSVALAPLSAHVLRAAALLQRLSEGVFDISQGTGAATVAASAAEAWSVDLGRLHKHSPDVRLDLGGIAKGLAVDRAVAALKRAGCAWGSVNAGGDLRAFGPRAVRLHLRDEQLGGTREWGSLSEGSFASSHLGPSSRSQLHGGCVDNAAHISVAAPRCIWADALTKLVAASGNAQHPLLARFGATAFIHPPA